MTKSEVAKKIYELSHITGEFKLRSGQISNEYFDKYLFEAVPEVLSEIAKIMGGLIPEGTELIAGLEMGGIPVVTAISLQTGMQAAFVRKKAKEYGTCKLAEGADVEGKHVSMFLSSKMLLQLAVLLLMAFVNFARRVLSLILFFA